MSGHSKWAQIKRQKGAKDAKRGLTFTKLSNAITIAVRQGGNIGDPDQNFRLRLAVDEARAANMPKENIHRAIERAAGKQETTLDEVVYEGFGPYGVSILVEAATDNKNRTTSEVKNIFEKNGGNMGQPGSVSYQFQQIGRIIAGKNEKSTDEIFLLAADSGAEDIEETGDELFIYAEPADLGRVREGIISKGINVIETELIRKPISTINISETDSEKVMQLLEKLEEHDDVQKVYSNFSVEL